MMAALQGPHGPERMKGIEMRNGTRGGFAKSTAAALALAAVAFAGAVSAQTDKSSPPGQPGHATQAGPVVDASSWARATVGASPVGAAYLTIRNPGGADRLLSVSSPAAGRVELHEHRLEGDIARMRQVEAIDLPAGAAIEMQPGGLHVMLMGLKAPLAAGEPLMLTLRFERAGEVRATIPVRASAPGAGRGSHKH